MAFRDVPTQATFAFLGFGVTLILFLTAFGSQYWLVEGCTYLGLWKGCVGRYTLSGTCSKTICGDVTFLPGYWKATQAMLCLALISGFAVTLLLLLFIFVDKYRYMSSVLHLAKFGGLATGILSLIGVGIFGAKVHERVSAVKSVVSVSPVDLLGWSYWLAVASSIIFLACGVLVLTVTRQLNTPPMHNMPMSSAQIQPATVPVQYIHQTPTAVYTSYPTPAAAYPAYPTPAAAYPAHPPPVQPTYPTPSQQKGYVP